MVGEKRISSFLKDLAAEAKTRACPDQPKEKAADKPQDSDSKSPIGSNKKGK